MGAGTCRTNLHNCRCSPNSRHRCTTREELPPILSPVHTTHGLALTVRLKGNTSNAYAERRRLRSQPDWPAHTPRPRARQPRRTHRAPDNQSTQPPPQDQQAAATPSHPERTPHGPNPDMPRVHATTAAPTTRPARRQAASKLRRTRPSVTTILPRKPRTLQDTTPRLTPCRMDLWLYRSGCVDAVV